MVAAADFTSLWTWGTLVGVGTALGLIIAYFASREYINQTMKVLKDTIDSQEQNLKAKDELALSIAETQKGLLAAAETRLDTMTAERDAYRRDLHSLREVSNAEKLELQELKLRPDLNQVLAKEEEWHKRREEFYAMMARNQLSIMELQKESSQILAQVQKDVKADLEQNHKVCVEVSAGLKAVVEKIEKRDEQQTTRDGHMMAILEAILVAIKNPATNAPNPA